jgi:protocatechuate 3,4-dioxygenase beta subunit
MPPSPEYLLSPSGQDSVFDPNSYMSYPVVLQSGEDGDGANAGMYMLASVESLVWKDTLANGIQDADESGFEGPVTVNLYDSSGSIVQTTQTDNSGTYKLADVVPGAYEIEFVVEDGYHFTVQDAGDDDTKDSDVDSSGKAHFTITSGEIKDIAAGITVLASVGPNTVFEDSNGNGIQDEGEPGAPDVVIHLVDESGTRISSTVSDENGEYEFQDIPPGDYSIQVDIDDGTSFSPVVEGGNQVSQVEDQPYGQSPVVELTVGTQENTWNVGLIQPVSVGNKVWNDLNGNGIQDADEPGMQGVTAILVDGSGNELNRMVTDENGLYLFEGLEPGTYAVKFDIPDEYLFTPPAKTTTPITDPVDGSLNYDDVTSDVNVDTGVTDAVFLSSGEENLSFDAGIFIPVNISGTTWHDLNANGIEEEGEPGLPGSTVTLYDRDGDFVGIQITDSNGDFLFEDLPPGTYHTVLSPPSPEYQLSPKENDNDSDFNPDTFETTPITLNSGESGEGSFDAGLYLPAKIGDRVWYDTELNGIQDADEGPFTETTVTITLRDSLGYLVDTTTPAPGTGFYQFDGLKPGTYELTAEIDELGYVFTMQNKGNDTDIDSDVNPTTGIVSVTVTSGEDNDSIDIGIMDDAPYYPDWQNDNQICTNDGFDPEWLEIQRVNYLYKNKEACCKAHFWWRITQCMQNEEFKFYKNGEICDTKIYFEDWESNSPADWTDTTQFDTLDECCVNMFWYDIDGCMERSPVMFKFEFCVDIKGLVDPQDCQSADIYANVLEDAINAGVNLAAETEADQDLTDANITSIGNVTLTKEKGSTICGGSMEGEDFINANTGKTPDIAAAANTVTTVCGVITVEDAVCTQEDCLREHYQNITDTMTEYINDGSFKEFLNLRAETRLPPVPELQRVSGVTGSFSSSNLLLPATITGDQNIKYYHGSDLTTCMEKTFFLETEVPYETLHECCKVAFHWDVRSCCINGGGCPELAIDESTVEYYPTWNPEKLCDSKPSSSFDTWEVNRFETIDECCDAFFPHQKTDCIKQHDV